MNEFTKEELRCLANSIRVTLGHEPVSDHHYEFHCTLRIKIQSMIDNYCEHESGWIDINQRLPDRDYVMAYCQSYPLNFVSMVRFEQRHTGEYYFWDDGLDKKAHVTHWMPLPEFTK